MIRLPARRATWLVAFALALAACGSQGPTPTASPAPPTPAASPDRTASEPTEPTPVPGGPSATPVPQPSERTTTETPWGTILDAVPADFPVFPGAAPAEPPAAPVSAAFFSSAGVDEVASWYKDALEAQGFATMGLSSALEDGSRVLDSQGDLPECRIQTTFRPTGGSTMITVLYAAGCAGGEG